MCRLREGVTFIRVDDELSRHTDVLQPAPELVRLGRGTLGVALTNNNEGRRSRIPDEINGRTFLVDLLVIVRGGSEERNHPLADTILSGITQPVGDSSASDRCLEAMALSHCPHRHEAAVAPATNAESSSVDRIRSQNFVEAGQYVAQVAMPEIFDIRARECLALSVTAARIGEKNEVARPRLETFVRVGCIKYRRERRRWATVHLDDKRIFFLRVEIGGIKQKALHVERVAFPFDADAASDPSGDCVVGVGELPARSSGRNPDFWRRRKRFAYRRDRITITRRR